QGWCGCSSSRPVMKTGPSPEGPVISELETTLPQTTKKLKDERGQTMTELALVLPILVVLILGIAQFGVAFNNYVTLTDAARAAARKGAVSRELGPAAATDACQSAGYAAGADMGSLLSLNCSSSWS